MLYTWVGRLDLEEKMQHNGNLTACEEESVHAMNNNQQRSKKHDRKNWECFQNKIGNY